MKSLADINVAYRTLTFKLGFKDAFWIACLMLFLLFTTHFQLELISFIRTRIIDFNAYIVDGRELIIIVPLVPFFLAALGLVVLHEMIHITLMKAFKVNILKLKLIKAFKVPLAIMVIYDEMSIKQYIAIALMPQAISIALLLMSTTLVNTALALQLFMLYMMHLIASAGDFYGIIKLLVMARTLEGRMKSIMEGGKLKEIHIILPRTP